MPNDANKPAKAGKSPPSGKKRRQAGPAALEDASREASSEYIPKSGEPEAGISEPSDIHMHSYGGEAPVTNHQEVDPMNTVEQTDAAAEKKPAPESCEIEAIIRKRVYGSMAFGLVPVPAFDLAALTAVQVEMLYRLAQAYDVPFKKEWGKKAVGVVLGAALPGLFAPTFANLVRYIPFVGTGLSIVSWPLTLGASTYALGMAFAKHFASGGDFLNCDLSKIGEQVKGGYEKGLDKVKGWAKGNKEEKAAAAS
jgi:uncharacterized protein (DUF697 family)